MKQTQKGRSNKRKREIKRANIEAGPKKGKIKKGKEMKEGRKKERKIKI